METRTPPRPDDPWHGAPEARMASSDEALNAEPEEAHVRGTRALRYERQARARWLFAIVVGLTLLAGGLRFYRLSDPKDYVFDEVYYAKDGCFVAGYPYQECELEADREQTVTVHPPLGRELIGRGIVMFGNREFGWRVVPAVFGTLTVPLVILLAYLLFDSLLWAGAAGLLLATEGLNFVQSRISMLDIFIATFVLAGFLFLVLDRRWIERRTPPPDPLTPEEREEALLLDLPPDRPPSPIFRPWRLAAGIVLGAAAAVKWSGGRPWSWPSS